LRIEDYFQQIHALLNTCPIALGFTIEQDRRSTHDGFIRAQVFFSDGSSLHVREFIHVQTEPERLAYAYQYLGTDARMIWRYDNAGHHRKLGLATYPHHKHVGEQQIVASDAPDLAAVLREVEDSIVFPR
jgi:hypothetical protein